MKKKVKEYICIIMWGHTALWSLIFLGMTLTLMIQNTNKDIILMTLYACASMGFLCLFDVGFSQLPFKKLNYK